VTVVVDPNGPTTRSPCAWTRRSRAPTPTSRRTCRTGSSRSSASTRTTSTGRSAVLLRRHLRDPDGDPAHGPHTLVHRHLRESEPAISADRTQTIQTAFGGDAAAFDALCR
jgi:hypothetical protein